jgi:uncharacterized protein YbgA (DUF1722 family)/uncharacterized protein YbbK (DUF523 family)
VSLATIQVGISSCLLGEEVRWDGGHKLDQTLIDQMGSFVQFCPVCPEVESGFTVPREPLCLTGDPHAPRLVTSRTKQDHTMRMLQWARERVRELEGEGLCGFIFKSKSPSCGVRHVRIYGVEKKGAPMATNAGLFTRVFMEHLPLVPVEDDGRLHDSELRAGFIERVFVMQRWRDTLRHKRSRGALVRFHTEHELVILSHSPRHHRIMGNLVARASAMPILTLYDEYQGQLLEALLLKATPAKHANCLHHIMGYLKQQLSPAERHKLQEVIDRYRQGHVPLIEPITLMNHYVHLYDQPYIEGQHYLY